MPKYLDGAGLSRFWNNIKRSIGSASQEQVDAWLDNHPEATTTVQPNTVNDDMLVQTGGVLSRVTALDGRMVPPLEMGNISMSNTTWTYSASSTRVRTPENVTVYLHAGDSIALNDGYVMFLGWNKPDSDAKISHGWLQSYVTPVDSQYVLLFRRNPEVAITIDEILQNLTITTSDGEVFGVHGALGVENLLRFEDCSKGYYDNGGNFISVNYYDDTIAHPDLNILVSDYISVSTGETYFVDYIATALRLVSSAANWMSVAFFDANKARVDNVYTNANDYVGYRSMLTRGVVAPTGAAYMRVSARYWLDGYVRVTRGQRYAVGNITAISDIQRVIASQGTHMARLVLSGHGAYVDLDTYNKTLTLPRDTILIIDSDEHIAIQLNSAAPLSISYAGVSSSIVKFMYSIADGSTYALSFDVAARHFSDVVIAVGRIQVAADMISMACLCPWRVDGIPYNIVMSAEYNVRSINHRGYSTAPENTLPAYRLSKRMGFDYAECDVSMTSDRVPVLLHDDTINRTARNADGTAISGTVNIGDITYEQALQYDFGIWKGAAYAGTKIPTFEQFIVLCRNVGLHPYIELKVAGGYTASEIQSMVDVVKNNGMAGKVTWISFSADLLQHVKDYDASARLGLVVNEVTSGLVTLAQALRTSSNDVFINAGSYSDEQTQLCIAADMPLEVWNVDSTSVIAAMPTYVSGFTTDTVHAGRALYRVNA